MTPYDRIKTAVSHQQPDRVPCDYAADPVVTERLCKYLELETEADLLDHLWIDRRHVRPRYIGPPLETFEDGSAEKIVHGGPRFKRMKISETVETDGCFFFPWADVETIEDLEGRWGWSGKLEWWDFSTIPEQLDELEARGQYWIAAHGDPSGLQHLTMWTGDEKFYMILAAEEDLAMAMIEKHNEVRLDHALRTLEAGGGRIHELHGGGDYATQDGLAISKDMFRRFFKPLYVNFYKEIRKHFDVEIFFHCCGAVAELIPELIEVGVTILDPIQVTAAGMEPERLKKDFGSSLTFHGGMDIQDLLPNGTEEEVRSYARKLINVLGTGGGYILSPTHALQTDTSVENILAMYEEAQGRKLIRS